MFGISQLPKISAFAPRRAATRTALAVAAASAALFAVASVAHAEDCIGGYRMVKGEIPVICSPEQSRAYFDVGQPLPQEPRYTGSINTGSSAEQPADATRPSSAPATAESLNSAATCDHGMRFVETPNSGATLMMKCS